MKNSDQPAFAVSREMCEISTITEYPFGLTKREYFAAKALQGLMTTLIPLDNNGLCPSDENVIYMAQLSVKAADFLLIALETEQNSEK